ncbi:MATE family efflux transporter [Shewanella sp. 1_MG-2023]|uniref:MATE family efflux transporter n=1 Tax=Shewanella electrodiphila TaxID=934143 RepID=A0ABT0KQ32_9GAMM|nr:MULTISPECIES: MATE family efflux transporter [Shewanella]MCC4832445.1 MATE family efflux transporter [Shewanella sp. 10N.7]MCL1045749.1 MATE family efflux transporter [Shewanella electrodiphila]MDO6610780.1 MATE family efflux transporter [Shewanella sp. 7_MG-2023]MDO6770369.1 MATE family efflux transporter [Shewanella sp. 2_MG-2023]MDO6793510.1 MATE family efflux transporter [Shewanella sp. 1_MG-2023]
MTEAKFVQGSILRHILVMSSTAAVGISALFVVDLLDIFFLSLLGEQELAAAVGYAGAISFFTTSIGIGLSIALGALVSRAIGAKNMVLAKRMLLNSAVVSLLTSVVVAVTVFIFIPELLALIGANGETAILAESYLRILVPSLPFICLAMALGGALRAIGDAKLSMMSTLAGGGVNLVLDPIFIFALGMGIEGAAIASVFARIAVFIISARGIVVKHNMLGQFNRQHFVEDIRTIFAIALPAMLTNVATPIGNAVVTKAIADFGDSYVAGWAVLGRLIPVCFGMIFALSGAVGPIIGQNYGALEFERVKESLTKAIQFCVVFVLGVSILLFSLKHQIVSAFDMQGEAAELILFFCKYIAIFFIFNGILFVANASFNNLGKAKYSTFFNVGKATIGTIPFVYFGAQIGGVYGVLIGQALGSILFGLGGVWVGYRLIDKITATEHFKADEKPVSEDDEIELEMSPTSSPQSSSYIQLAQLNEEPLCEEIVRDGDLDNPLSSKDK